MEIDVGARLRAIREKSGLSQRQLAQRAGVTNGTISLIEQNRSSPSVASLRKVLGGIPITLAEFFSQDALPPAEQIFFHAGDLVELASDIPAAKKGAISFLQVGDLRGRNLQVLKERYEPGADTGTGKNMLQHESEEGGVVIEGEVELTVGDQKQILKPGDAYLFDSRIPHRFRNIGDKPCMLISACTPPYL
ncbi:MAG TPA: cupin domain-containing protein [Telmatospirillum sp.]|nr:cupin domain-containing protein [Telmatospirillum sp.]